MLTKHPKLGDINRRNLSSHSFAVQKPDIGCQGDRVLPEAPGEDPSCFQQPQVCLTLSSLTRISPSFYAGLSFYDIEHRSYWIRAHPPIGHESYWIRAHAPIEHQLHWIRAHPPIGHGSHWIRAHPPIRHGSHWIRAHPPPYSSMT